MSPWLVGFTVFFGYPLVANVYFSFTHYDLLSSPRWIGLANTVLGKLGITGPLWFQSPSWSKPSLVLLALWGVGNTMIIFMAALLDVPRHLYESADLDGAGWFNRLRYVTLPTVSPVILFAVIIAVIETLQYFTQGYVAATTASPTGTGAVDTAGNNLGYPQGSTLFYPVWLYQQGFGYFNMGYAAAMSVMLLLAARAITLLLLRGSRRVVHYQGLAR